MRRFRSLFALSLLAYGFAAHAADEPASASSGFRERYSQAALDSIPKADAALTAAKSERSRVEREYRTAARGCMDRFLVNDCLNRAREVQRSALGEVTAVEVDANRFKRKDRGEKTDADLAKREAERAANAKADADLRSRNKSTYDSRQTTTDLDAERAGTRTAPRAKKAPIEKNAEAAAVQRAKNVDAHTGKLGDAAEHKKELDRRRAAKVAERERRAAEKAAKAAASQTAKPPAT